MEQQSESRAIHDLPGMLSIQETAEALGLSLWTVRRLIAKGEMLSVKIGARVLITAPEVARIIGEGTRRSGTTRARFYPDFRLLLRAAQFLGVSIDVLEISARTYNCLRNAGFRTISDVVTKTDAEMRQVAMLGRKSHDEVKAAIASLWRTW